MTRIVFALYPGVTQLDFTGPHQVFSRLPNAQVTCASLTGEAVEADGLVFSGLAKLPEIEGCDVLCVPGGYGTESHGHLGLAHARSATAHAQPHPEPALEAS